MDDAFKKQAGEWFERGRHDIETAQLLYDQRGYKILSPTTSSKLLRSI